MSSRKTMSQVRKSLARKSKRLIRSEWLVLALVTAGGFVLHLRKIHLFTADLGRHLANGREIFRSLDVLSRNYYSYTFPDFPFVNHHWGSGVLFHLWYHWFGFVGLSLLNSAMIASALFAMGIIVCLQSNARIALLIFGLCLPMTIARTEVRPESFSYLFLAIFYGILWSWSITKLHRRWLWILPLMIVIWVNLHIYFFLGFILFAAFSVDRLSKLRSNRSQLLAEIRFLAMIGSAMILATFFNPLGWRIAIYPTKIFENYGYMIAENQSIPFFWRHPMRITEFVSFHALALIMGIGAGYLFWKKPEVRTSAPILLGSFGTLMGFLAIRNFSLCGLLGLPAFSLIFYHSKGMKIYRPLIVIAVLAVAIAVPTYGERIAPYLRQSFGPGLLPGMTQAIQFFRDQGLKGPVLNNYDIGGYLIFHLFPDEKVFVDNRPEAYPADFFEQIYIPLQENNIVFAQASKRYGFNTIFFYRHDNTPAGQNFLISRIQDDAWIPVFVDDSSLIMVRNTSENADVIRRFALPKSMFRVGS